MPRNRRASDDAYNKRRKAQRFINSLKKQQDRSKSAIERKALGKYIRNLEKQVKKTYRGSGADPNRAFSVLDNATSFASGRNSKQRANKIFQQQLGLASANQQSSLGKMGKAKSKIFYAATQRLWEGFTPSKRNEAIMAALGTDSLAEAYDIVMKKQKSAVNYAKGLNAPIGNTEENSDFYEDMGLSDIETSPDYLAKVVKFQ